MKFRQNQLVYGLVIAGSLTSQTVIATDDGRPLIYGNLNSAVVDGSAGNDIHTQAIEAAFGIRGIYKDESLAGLKVAYRFELEATKAVNNPGGEEIIEVKNATIALPSSYGTVVLAARGESGQQKNLYGPVDLFDVYEANRRGGLFDQPDEASGILAYVSPKFAGGFQFIAASLNLGESFDDNDEHSDARAARLLYLGDTVSAGIGYVGISDKVVPTDDYHRVQGMIQYKFAENSHIAATYEQIKDQPALGDFNTFGIAGRYRFASQYDVNLGHYSQDSDDDNGPDNNATVLSLRKHLNERIYAYVEYADFDEPDLGHLAIGINVGFRGTP